MNKKQVIKINENQLNKIVSESVKRVLKEGGFRKTDFGVNGTFSNEAFNKHIQGITNKIYKIEAYANSQMQEDLCLELIDVLEKYGFTNV